MHSPFSSRIPNVSECVLQYIYACSLGSWRFQRGQPLTSARCDSRFDFLLDAGWSLEAGSCEEINDSSISLVHKLPPLLRQLERPNNCAQSRRLSSDGVFPGRSGRFYGCCSCSGRQPAHVATLVSSWRPVRAWRFWRAWFLCFGFYTSTMYLSCTVPATTLSKYGQW